MVEDNVRHRIAKTAADNGGNRWYRIAKIENALVVGAPTARKVRLFGTRDGRGIVSC